MVANNEGVLVKTGDVARLLGVSDSTVRRLTREGRLPAPVGVLGKHSWRRADVERWIADGCPPREQRAS